MKAFLIKNKIAIGVGTIFICIFLFLICYFNIPRISYSYNEKTDSYYVDRVYGNAKHYTIQDTVKGKPVTAIGAKAFMDKKKLEGVTFGTCIREVERLSFSGCKRLKEFNFDSVEQIGRNAFADCVSLKQVYSSATVIDGGAFYGCTALEEITLTDTKWIGSFAFANTAIVQFTIPNSLKSLGVDAFYQCQFLREILVPSKLWLQDSYLLSLENVKIVE